MKKLVLFVMAVMAFAGMSVAQDVWTSGYYTDSNGKRQPAVYKNATRMYNLDLGGSIYGECSDLDVYSGDVYWVKNVFNSDGSFHYADLMKNNSIYLNSPSGEGRHIYDLYRFPSGSTLIATGCKTIGGVETAVAWKNNGADVHRQMGDGTYSSCAYGATGLNAYLYTCGVQYTSSSAYHGVIWKESTAFHSYPDGTVIYDIAHFNGYFYAVGTAVQDGATKLRVWETPDDGSTGSHVLYTLASSNAYGSERTKIYVDEAGDIYVTGQEGSLDKVWKNGSQLYSTSDYYTSVLANTNGVYYTGRSGAGRVWKDGSLLYSPSGSYNITNIRMEEPPCTNTQVRGLPFTEDFENGSTSWPCWTVIDEDGNNNSKLAYWFRSGSRLGKISGNYSARHEPNTDTYQKGWLVTPRLFLQPGQDNATLSFQSSVTGTYTLSVYVTTDVTPTATGNWTRVVNQSQSSGTQTISTSLNDYMGQAIYIAFKYTGNSDRVWMIDDVSVTESFSPCSVAEAPYSWNFDSGYGSCWTGYDADMSGDENWQLYEWSDGTKNIWHKPSSTAQVGWLYSRRVTLPTGNFNYTLTYLSKNSGNNGTGESHTVWIALDKTGPYVPSDYNLLYTEPDYTSSWTERTIDLTPYKGHTVSIAFKYMGANGHHWNVDDFAISQAAAEYTINVNANNNSWGTVSGGGTYPAGATCTLLASPASGYQFDCWKLNGSVVSNSPQYSFTVTENATYTAYFAETPVVYYTITTEVTPSGAGSITGGGTYPAGSSITLEAVNNPGWTFAHWQDNNSSNPRTITVTGDATYTATFTQDNYVITTNVSPAGAGTVTGGGAYHYGNVATLTATANSGYEFAGWNDGNTDNPRAITVTQSETYTAFFNEVGTTMYAVTASVNPVGAGTVTGTGTFPAGTVTTLEAVANAGYTFDHWQDGITANPRTVTVNNNMNFTAYFTRNQYIITVVASPSNGGIVSGGGAYYYGDYTTLTAIPNSGYEFVGWSDGSNEPNHTVMVTGNATYTATFAAGGSTYYTVSAYVSPTGAGTVSGTGTFPAGSTTTLTAIANSGYAFDHWNDGSTTNPRTVTVNNNMSFTAYFNSDQYTITVNANPTAGGTVTGGGSYPYGATVTLTATANSGYSFLRWNDGNTSNVRTITVTGNATYTALFMAAGGETYVLTVTSGNLLLGQVTGGGVYPAGAPAEIRAIPASYATFLRWNDGNTDNPRTVIMNSDLEFVAEFGAAQTYTITVLSSNEEMGQVFGGGTFVEGSTTEISALAYEGYMFTGWNDGNTDNPRTITVTGNATYTAQFAESSTTTYTLTLICNTSEGTVSGGGVYMAGATAIIQAFPNPGHVFSKWSDENSQNPRIITMNSDMTLVAFFATGVGENEKPNLMIYPNPAKESIRILGIEANTSVAIYNSLGELVKVVSASENQEINVRDLAAGLYMVHFGNATLRFVKEQ
jgi:uncharacterized repeat protein (TIGR02543 family)